MKILRQPFRVAALATTLTAAMSSFAASALADHFFATTVIDPIVPTSPTPLALGGPRGLGNTQGSLHVMTLGAGGHLTVGFDGDLAVGVLPARRIVDDPGADFIVSDFPAQWDPKLGIHVT